MKRKFLIAACLVALGICLGLRRERKTESAPLVDNPDRHAFLIQFGIDDKEDVDWSGTVSCSSCRIGGWQFTASDEVSGNSWKCSTRRELYWDTPYERRMKHTSTRSKVTHKGILIESEKSGSDPIRVETREGALSFPGNLAIGDAPL